MNPPTFLRRTISACLVGLVALAALGAIQKGATVFAKRNDTPLLTEPKPLAPAAGKVAFAASLKIEEIRNNWLRVSAGRVSGWIFSGNVAEERPKHAPGAGLTTVSASETNTAAAARPLSPVGDKYAARHSAGKSKADVEWLDQQATQVTATTVEDYLREHGKGEYQP